MLSYAHFYIRPVRLLFRSLNIVALMIASIGGGFMTAALPGPAQAADSAVVVMYHRFGEKKFPSTNITLEQFEAHIDVLKSGPYTVLPLPEIVARVRNGEPLPERTIGISIDDAYRSAFTEAWPRLKKAQLPFTVFVSTNHVDRQLKNMMTWDQIRTLVQNGVTIGHHTATHLHMADNSLDKNKKDMAQASARFQKELGFVPKLFAYPYGEAGLDVMRLAKESGFQAAFGQHSGAMDRHTNVYYLPRFAMNETYGNAARFKLAINAVSLPVTDITPEDPVVGANNPPAIGFTVAAPVKRLNRLACYTSHAGRAGVQLLGENRIEVRVGKPFGTGRTRLNCTLPASDGRWRWFGRQYYVPAKTAR